MVDKMEFYDADTALHEVDKKRLNDMLDFAKNYQWKELGIFLLLLFHLSFLFVIATYIHVIS